MRTPVISHLKNTVRKSDTHYRQMTSQMRLLPDFAVIGAQKCGTTSLYRLVTQHPCVKRAARKEVHYFDMNFKRGVNWYRAQFPLLAYKHYAKRVRKLDIITGEASPYYLFHPHVPKRMAALIPQAKLIVLLRNPVERTYSHYHHELRRNIETLSFEDAIAIEEERLKDEIDKLLNDETYYSFKHQHFSYLSRGIYVDQLKAFEKYFDREQILILKSEDFFSNTSQMVERVFEFLNLPEWRPKELESFNTGSYSKITPQMRTYLSDYFAPHNQRLYEYLGVDFGW